MGSMKYFVIIGIVVLCAGCSAATPHDEPIINSDALTISLAEPYTFPADDLELAFFISRAELAWHIEARPNGEQAKIPDSPVASHIISNSSGQIKCAINQQYSLDKYTSFTFAYASMPSQQEYTDFLEDDFPLLWHLAGELFIDMDVIQGFSEECMSYFDSYQQAGQGMLVWWGRKNDVFCRVRYLWNPEIERYLLDSIDFFETFALKNEIDNYIKYLQSQGPAHTVSEINVSAVMPVSEFLVSGHLENLEINMDMLDVSTVGTTIPANTSLYQKGLLLDESGSILVYVAPTPLTGVELSEDRLHAVRIVDAAVPYCIIYQSATNYSYY